MTPQEFCLTKPAYTINELLQMRSFGGRTTIYSEIKKGRMKVVKRGRNTIALTPDLVEYLIMLREESNAI